MFSFLDVQHDILLKYPRNNDLRKITNWLNIIAPSTDFTSELDNNNT